LRVKIAANVRKTSARGEANSVALLVAGTELEELAAAEVLDPPAAALVLLLPALVPLLEPVAEVVELLAPVAVELVLLAEAVVVAINEVEVETREEDAVDEPDAEPVDEAVVADADAVAPRSWN